MVTVVKSTCQVCGKTAKTNIQKRKNADEVEQVGFTVHVLKNQPICRKCLTKKHKEIADKEEEERQRKNLAQS
jgi:hypothetical protein